MKNQTDYRSMTAGDFAQAVGIDAVKWTDAFYQILGNGGWNDRETVQGWFANAIMAGYDTANNRRDAEEREAAVAQQDTKYRFERGRVVNRASGDVIPLDEPIFLFRARDNHTVTGILGYRDCLRNKTHAMAVLHVAHRFEQWMYDNKAKMKEPDTDVSVGYGKGINMPYTYKNVSLRSELHGAGSYLIVEMETTTGDTHEMIREFAALTDTSISHCKSLNPRV
jgi:hypothetical protein